MVSVVVSIRMRKMFAEVRKMFLNARDAEQDGRESLIHVPERGFVLTPRHYRSNVLN